MLLGQIKKLKELQEQHAYALAHMKQQGESFADDREKLATLALFDLNCKITNAIHEYAEIVGNDDVSVAASVSMLAGTSGALSGLISQNDPVNGEKILAFAEDYMKSQYERYK